MSRTYGYKPSMTSDLFQTLCEVCKPRDESEVEAVHVVTLSLAEALDYDTADRLCRLLTHTQREAAAFERSERFPNLFPRH